MPIPFCACRLTVLELGNRGLLNIHSCGLAWGSANSIGGLAIHKVIIHKANKDYIISSDELVEVLSILLTMEEEAFVTLWCNLPILLRLRRSGAHSGSKKRLKFGTACKEDILVSVYSHCISLLLESMSMLVKQDDRSNGQWHSMPHIVQTNGFISKKLWCCIFISCTCKISGFKRILEYGTIMRHKFLVGTR